MWQEPEWVAKHQAVFNAHQAEIAKIRTTNIPQLSGDTYDIAMDADHFPRVLQIVPLASFGPKSGTYKWAWSNATADVPDRYGPKEFRDAAARLDTPILAEKDTFVLPRDQAHRLFGALAITFGAHGLVVVDHGSVETIDLVTAVSEPGKADVPPRIWRNILISFLNASMVAPFNALRRALPDYTVDLAGIDLRGTPMDYRGDLHVAILREHGALANFASLQLSGVDLSNTRLDEAKLNGADLSGADLTGAIMIDTNLAEANLTNAKLDRAWLHRTSFNEATLDRTSFEGAEMSGTQLSDVDLSTATGLEHVRHLTNSDVSFSTLVKSKFRISQRFLRQSGVSIGLLEDLRRGGRINTTYGSCFISFSSTNRDFAERLEYGLAAAGARTYLDENNLTPGMDLDTQFLNAIREHDHVITVLSEAAMTSEWVARETALALEHSPKGYTPIRLCALEPVRAWYVDSFGKDETKDRLILSFEGWEDEDRFARQLKRLLSGIAR